jgi:serine/threonine protein kinase
MIEIPNYEIGRMVGKGGVAEVYLAQHKLIDRSVAIKIISPTQTDAFADKRFLKEAKVVSGLHHPNIVSIYDVGILENKYYIVMEYLSGGNLKRKIKQGITASQSLTILKQIGSALAHAHSKKFIHRDIKSQNIMFRSDGTAVLTDFGIVKDLAVESGYTLDGTSIGTPHYMSPEQAQGASEIDWRTDLYSLGVTFYEMLTGSLPYSADSAIAVALKHIKDPVPKLPEHLSRFQPVIDKLMAKKPEKRYQTGLDLIHAIDALEEKDLPTETLTTPIKFRRSAKPLRLYFFLILIFVFCGLVFYRLPDLITLFNTYTITRKTPINDIAPEKAPESADAADTQDGRLTEKIPQQDLAASGGEDFLSRAISQKQYNESLDYILKMRKDTHDPSNAMLREADGLLESKQYMKAGDAYNSVLSGEPRNQSAALGLLYAAIEKKQDLERQTKPAIADYDAYLSLLNKAIENTGRSYFKQLKTDMGAHVFALAQNLHRAQELHPAGQWVETGLKFNPDHSGLKKLSYIIRAQISMNENRLTTPEENNALAFYQQVLNMDPDDIEAQKGMKLIIEKYREMALSAQKEKKFKEAASLIQKARSLDSENTEIQVIEWIILGDNEASGKTRAEFYLKALTADPGNPFIKTKIEDAAKDLGAKGNSNDAAALLTQALQITPEHSRFKELMQSVDLFQKEKDKISASLDAVKKVQSIEDKTEPYKTLFSNLNFAVVKLGREKTSAFKQDVIEQVKKDTQSLKNQNQIIPAEFMDLVTSRLPELKQYMINTQYDILIQNGDKAPSNKEAADYYLEAFRLDKTRTDAKDKIVFMVMNMQKSGPQNEALSILQEAAEIAPDDLQLKELITRNEPVVKVFATDSGCGEENIINKTSVFIEKLNICIQYQNVVTDAIVKVVLESKSSPSMEIPVVLTGRSGNKPVSIPAPIEGFSPGHYSITLKQNGKTISESVIEFVSKRR